jgi:hypothetical protein
MAHTLRCNYQVAIGKDVIHFADVVVLAIRGTACYRQEYRQHKNICISH